MLRRQGLAGLAGFVLEAAGPLNIVGAQLIYAGQPLLPGAREGAWGALAQMLEEEDETRAFTALLKGKAA